jgi:6-pyruvoyltetrahydropterin/6-carboxytetrahydropterin synthase
MMYKLTAEKTFSSAHALRGYKGKCENIHGHNWRVRVVVGGKKLNNLGMLVDFHVVKYMLDEVVESLDHTNLNEINPFEKVNPSAENIAAYIYKGMKKTLREQGHKGVSLAEVTVWESETSSATVSE